MTCRSCQQGTVAETKRRPPDLAQQDLELVPQPRLEENERLFGIPLDFLLTVDGRQQQPERVYRKIQPVERVALRPEEAWVKREA